MLTFYVKHLNFHLKVWWSVCWLWLQLVLRNSSFYVRTFCTRRKIDIKKQNWLLRSVVSKCTFKSSQLIPGQTEESFTMLGNDYTWFPQSLKSIITPSSVCPGIRWKELNVHFFTTLFSNQPCLPYLYFLRV